MKQLIVNADDFGLSAGVNRGILDGHRQGIITSTTVLINGPEAPAGLDTARREAADLGVGLHLNLTWGRPVSAPGRIRSLVDENGAFYGIRPWSSRMATFDPEHLEAEITAQFERFVSLTGMPPDHLDAHHHAIYLHPAALRVAVRLARDYHLPLRSAGLDLAPQAAIRALKHLLPDLTDEAAQFVLDRIKAAAAEEPAAFWPARLELGFTRERATLGELLLILTDLPEESLTEIVCHPGHADQDPAQEWREVELGHLTHAATLECVKSEKIQLVNFATMQRPSQPRLVEWNDDLRRDDLASAAEESDGSEGIG